MDMHKKHQIKENEMPVAYTRPDGVKVIPLACMKDQFEIFIIKVVWKWKNKDKFAMSVKLYTGLLFFTWQTKEKKSFKITVFLS